jgi:hypothetical protein
MTLGRPWGLVLGLATALLGCMAEPSDPILIEGACGEIVEACHTKDDGTPGQINDCHQIAHDEVESECSANHATCIELCNAAPDVVPHDTEYGGSEHGSTSDHESTTEPDESSSSSTSGGASSSSSSSTGEDPSSSSSGEDPSCAALGSNCHDVPGEVALMCHDVGHDGDELACAEIWQACREACGF